jgi:hypothetical protein
MLNKIIRVIILISLKHNRIIFLKKLWIEFIYLCKIFNPCWIRKIKNLIIIVRFLKDLIKDKINKR